MRKTAFSLALCLVLSLFAGCGEAVPTPVPADFSVSLTWNCYGVSSYDSATGKLVKTSDATHPEDFVTTYFLTDAEKQTIFAAIEALEVAEYPDEYDPNKGLMTSPTETLVLTVHAGDLDKTISCKDIAISSAEETRNRKGKRFRAACETIRDIVVASDAWKALPEYERLYD